MLTREELERLKKRLPKGYFRKTTDRSTMSERSVANFFNGKAYNLKIHQAAVDVAEEYENEINAVIERSKYVGHEK